MKGGSARKLLAIAVATVLPGSASALDYMLDAGTRVEYSNNIFLTPANEKHGWVGVVSSGIRMREDGPYLKANLAGSVEYQDYRSDQFQDRTNVGLNGTAVWSPLPEQFTWTAEDVFSQVVRDRRLVDLPTNLENANAFSTGPDLFLRLNPVNTLNVGGRYADYYFENVETGTGGLTGDRDSTRTSGVLRWIYRATPRTTLSLNYTGEQTEFDDSINNENFKRRDAFFSWQTRITQTGSSANLDLGGTTVERERSPEVQGFLGRLSVNRQSTRQRYYRLAASAEYTDNARDIRTAGLTGGDPTLVSVPGQTDILYAKQADASISNTSGFLVMVMRAYGRSEEYEVVVTDDIKTVGGGIEMSYKLTAALTASVVGNWSKSDYQNVDRIDRIASGGFGLAYRAREPLTVNLNLTRNERVSEGAVAGQEYEEFRAALGISYRYQTPGSRTWE